MYIYIYTGIVEKTFIVKANNDNIKTNWTFKITDVGGQRTERKKWFKLFADTDVVIYVMSLSSYDQYLFEDNSQNCWDETFELFKKIVNNIAFINTDFIIFLNKMDIFNKKIKSVPITQYNKRDFDEKTQYSENDVKSWVLNKYNTMFNDANKQYSMNNNNKTTKRDIYHHYTIATNTDNVEKVIKVIQLQMIKRVMLKSALM